jgi:hypothetical protein
MNSDFSKTMESAIMANWADLLPGLGIGSVHVEYAFSDSGELNHLEVWSSKVRGNWLLACTYSDAATRFENGIQSKRLAHTLDVMMRRQKAFILPPNLGPHGMIQVDTPSLEQRATAASTVNRVLEQIGPYNA